MQDALVEAHVRHLLEVAFYDQRGNAIGMWGKDEVHAKLREFEDYKAFVAPQ